VRVCARVSACDQLHDTLCRRCVEAEGNTRVCEVLSESDEEEDDDDEELNRCVGFLPAPFCAAAGCACLVGLVHLESGWRGADDLRFAFASSSSLRLSASSVSSSLCRHGAWGRLWVEAGVGS
jgi:hypothetical protein